MTKPEFSDIEIPLELIEKGDSNEVEKYLKIQVGLDSFNMKELRDRAAILRVYPIFGLCKSELIRKIREKQNEQVTAKKESV